MKLALSILIVKLVLINKKAELELHTKSMNDLKSKTQRAEYEFRQANDVYQQLLNQKQNLGKSCKTANSSIKLVYEPL